MDQLYTIHETAHNVATVCPGATDEDKTIFLQWLGLGLRDIGPQSDWVKTCELFPKNNVFVKPKDMVYVIDIALYDSQGAEIRYNFQPSKGSRIHLDRFQIFDNILQGAITTRVDLSEDAHQFFLGTNGNAIHHALIRYFAMAVDDDGFPLIPEVDVFPLMMFCRYMWALKKGDNQSEIQLSKQTWYEERDRAKGRAKMPSQLAGTAILKSWMSLINAPKWSTV